MKSLYLVRKKNPFWGIGTYVERFSEGVEKCVTGMSEGRMTIEGHEGFVIPWRECEAFLMKVQRNGFDAGSVRQDRRRRQGKFVDQQTEMERESVEELNDSVHERRLWPVQGTKSVGEKVPS